MLPELRRTTTTAGQFPHLIQEHRALERVKLRHQRSDLCQERIREYRRGFPRTPALPIPQQIADVDLQRIGQPLQRRERGHRFPIFNLRNIGARNLHTASQLPLAEAAAMAHFANSPRHVDALIFLDAVRTGGHQLRRQRFGFFNFEGLAATPAQGIRRAELHQATEVATKYLTGLNSC